MGQSCSLPQLSADDEVDNFEGSNTSQIIAVNQERFERGLLPIVNQNPRTFNDDDPIDPPKRKGAYDPNRFDLLQQQEYNLAENLQIQVQSQGIRQRANEQEVVLLVSLITNEIKLYDQMGGQVIRPGVDLICVIDHSGSMSGPKIQLVKRTLKHMLEFLQPNDRLCLIQFDCRCYRLTRLMRVTPENKSKFRIAIHAIQARGGTNIENGMHMAFSVLKHRRYKNPVSAIFLLSDGVDEGAEERVRESLQKAQIRDPFTIKTFGFGQDVCPRLMSEIAHFKEGQFYFVPDIKVIDECFVEALGGLVSVVANNVRISVQPQNASRSKITKAYGDKWQFDSWNNTYSLYQPHLLSGVRKDFVFEVVIARNNQQSNVLVRVEADPIDGSQKKIFEQNVNINQDNLGQQNNEVLTNLMRVQGAQAFNDALQHAENGNYQRAQQMINQTLLQLQQQYNLPPDDPQLMMVKADLEQAQDLCNQQDYNNMGRHYLMQLHIVHMYQKSRGVQIYAQDQYGNIPINCAYQNNIQKAYIDQTRQFKYQNPNYDYSDE